MVQNNVDKLKIGELLKVTNRKNTYIGTLMPKSELGSKNTIVLKLENGYNVGIEMTPKTKIEILKNAKNKPIVKKEPIKFDSKKKTIAILHTGGTIASKVDYETGAVSASFSPEEILAMFPEISRIANFKSKLIANALSENLRFAHYNLFIDAIAKEVKSGVDGIILTHGTDTMSYTAAALSFALENVPIPVIIVGAQRSSDRGSSDAEMNLVCASHFIANTKFAGVAICMHDGMSDTKCAINPAAKTRKMHTSRRDAFKAINTGKIATVDSKTGNIIFEKKDYAKKQDKKMVVRKFKDVKVGILRAHPNMTEEEIDVYRKNKFDGLIIEGTGLGHLNIIAFDDMSKPNEKVFAKLKKLVDSGCIVAMTSQAVYGRVNMNVYSAGRELLSIGVLGNMCDMLPETAFVKLSWLLSNFKKDDIEHLYGTNLRGEITERSEEDFFED